MENESYYTIVIGARSSVVGSGTLLQDGRTRFRFSKITFDFFVQFP
jgi:hypothetical protein